MVTQTTYPSQQELSYQQESLYKVCFYGVVLFHFGKNLLTMLAE